MIHSPNRPILSAPAMRREIPWAMYVVLALVILFSTWLHHLHPEVLGVPSVTDVTTWKNPAFEQTLLFERMTPSERDLVRAEGLTDCQDLSVIISNDVFMILVGLICFAHAARHFSPWMASCFFIGSFVFTGLEESIWILFGRFLGGLMVIPVGGTLYGTYWFTKGGLWFIETPIVACLGWFAIAYSFVYVAGQVFPKMGLWGRAALGGLLAMGTDLWQDPVQTSPELMNWIWAKGDALLFFGIPVYNFLGWFLLIFAFAVLWETLPRMEAAWGRPRANTVFLGTCIAGSFAVAVVILVVSLFGFGTILELLGATQSIQIPRGW